MARPKKFNADYFSHDNNMRNHRKILALRQNHWLIWYAIYNMLLEYIASCDNFTAKWDEIEIELLSGDFWISPKELEVSATACHRLNLIQIKDWIISCQSLSERLQDLVQKRERERNRFLPQPTAEMPQSKVKEIKVKENKEKEKENEIVSATEIGRNELEEKNNFKQKARAVETKWNFIIKLWNEKTWRNDMMEQATFNSLLNLIYNLNIEDFAKRVDKFIFIKKFIINAWVDKYLKSKIQRYDITMFLKNINLFATDDKGIIASICEKEYASKVGGMYATYSRPVMVQKWDPVPMKTVVPMDPAKAREALDKMRKTFWKK